MKIFFVLALNLLFSITVFAQDSVTVTFRYNASSSPQLFLVGEFNKWDNTATPMQFIGGNIWTKNFTLAIGGNPNPPSVGVPGAWQYKFFYTGAQSWPNDPLNHHENPKDNNNTFIITKDPTILYVLPNQRQPIVTTNLPTITSYIYPKNGTTIDTSKILLKMDGISITGLGKYYDAATKQLAYTVLTPLANGKHTIVLTAGSSAGGINSDTVNFTTQAGFVQITTQGGYATRNKFRSLRGIVNDTSIHIIKIVRNGFDTTFANAVNGTYTVADTLTEGKNIFVAVADTNGTKIISDSVTFTYVVDHSPFAQATVASASGNQLTLSASGSKHPDGKSMQYKWIDDPTMPLGLNGRSGETVGITKPTVRGEYYFTLVASDTAGRADTTRSYFMIKDDGTYQNPTIASNPEWAKRARVYFLFPKSFTQSGTINGAAQRLQYIKDLGFNVIWMMPVMKNAYPIDQHYGPGYNIVDFYNVAPEYGTNQDFKNFISQAHTLGIKVILDVTPNHTSRFHPWSQDAHLFKQNSRYWTWYEHTNIPHNSNGLGQSFDADGFNYYSGFSEQLLNYNWTDIDARAEMINAYKYWIKDFGLDGYRFDVYWGPHRRYGEQYMGKPLRDALKHIKPDIFLLGEDDGTGSGTETIYADYTSGGINGGLDAAYDFKLYFNQIRSFGFTPGAIDNLNNDIINAGFYPGPNSLYMRFMESQDEDRIAYFYSGNNSLGATETFKRTMPMATAIFSAPGFPMIWNGQEVGFGYGISGAKEDRARSTINWNFDGKTLLIPHYQRLAWIRGTYRAFATQNFARIATGNDGMYGIVRSFDNENGISLCNMNSTSTKATLTIVGSGSSQNVLFSKGVINGKPYFMNDVYNDTSYIISFASGSATFDVTLPGYGSAVFILSDSVRKLIVPTITAIVDRNSSAQNIPTEYSLSQNYPNPFNPSTVISYQLSVNSYVTLKVYDVIGREVATLVNERQEAGTYQTTFNAKGLSSGLYFYQLKAGNFVEIKKMLLTK